jgi:DNA-binding NarL/FixJ family response regulator
MKKDRSNFRILICHSIPLIREGIKKVLTETAAEYRIGSLAVEETSSNKLSEIESLLKKANMVVVGYDAVVESTVNCIQEMKKLSPKLKILVLAQNLQLNLLLRVYKSGANGLIILGADRAEISYAAAQVLGGKNYASPVVVNKLIGDAPSSETFILEELSKLTEREKEIFQLIAEGFTQKEIAKTLFISWKTVMTHRYRIMKKLKLKNCVELAKFAIRTGIIRL